MNPNLKLARPEILTLQPYVYAAWDHRFERMHANENPWRASGDDTALGLNLYPESPAEALHARVAELYGVQRDQVLCGRGSDEGIRSIDSQLLSRRSGQRRHLPTDFRLLPRCR
ncbi:MAG: hypothetical protein QM808_04645 [Steroidobacteraceae bacterium]